MRHLDRQSRSGKRSATSRCLYVLDAERESGDVSMSSTGPSVATAVAFASTAHGFEAAARDAARAGRAPGPTTHQANQTKTRPAALVIGGGHERPAGVDASPR